MQTTAPTYYESATLETPYFWGVVDNIGQAGGGIKEKESNVYEIPVFVIFSSMGGEIEAGLTILSRASGIFSLVLLPGDNRIKEFTPIKELPASEAFGHKANWVTSTEQPDMTGGNYNGYEPPGGLLMYGRLLYELVQNYKETTTPDLLPNPSGNNLP